MQVIAVWDDRKLVRCIADRLMTATAFSAQLTILLGTQRESRAFNRATIMVAVLLLPFSRSV